MSKRKCMLLCLFGREEQKMKVDIETVKNRHLEDQTVRVPLRK